MPVSNLSLIERIARVIAGRVVSINAGGEDPSAGDRVDSIWRDYRDDALSVIRTLREPRSGDGRGRRRCGLGADDRSRARRSGREGELTAYRPSSGQISERP